MTDLPIKIRGLSEPGLPLFDSVAYDDHGWISEGGTVLNQEKAFIASSWCHKERANPVYFWVSKRAFHHQFYLNVVCFLVDARPELFLIAYNEDRPDQILGWVCSSQTFESDMRTLTTHTDWVIYQHYIKEDFRDYGVKDVLIGLRDVPRPSRDCEPYEFERLINDTRKNQVAGGTLPGTDARTRQALQSATRSADGA